MIGSVELELFDGGKTKFSVARNIGGYGSHECILGTPFLEQIGVMKTISNKISSTCKDVEILNE